MSDSLILNDEGAQVYLFRNWYPDHQALHDDLVKLDTWTYSTLRIMGKDIPVPRRLMFLGNPSVKSHVYSSTPHTVYPWTEDHPIKSILDRVVEDDRVKGLFEEVPSYNACLLNHYRDGSDSISMHSDKEAKDPVKSVISLSLGGSRIFKLAKYKDKKVVKGSTIKVQVDGGDLMIMLGRTNELYKHGIDKVKKDPWLIPSRISLTYRHLYI